MKTRRSILLTALAVPSLALPLCVLGASTSPLPPAHTEGIVTYVSGGVGTDEAKAITHVAKYYPLELVFVRKAKPNDEYLAGVTVRIKDAQHKMILNTTSEGPFLLAKLPAGSYTVSAERNHKIENRDVHIVAKEHRRVVFEWMS